MQGVAEAALDDVGAKLGGPLEVRQGAQELHLVVLQLALPLGPPVRPVTAQIAEFALHNLGPALDVRQAPGNLGQRAVVLRQRLDGGVHGGDRLAVEFHLLADVPVERARHQALPRLRQEVERAAAAGVDGADGGHLAERGIAGMHQRHQVRQGNVRGGGFGMAHAHLLAHRAQNGDEFSAFHAACSRWR